MEVDMERDEAMQLDDNGPIHVTEAAATAAPQRRPARARPAKPEIGRAHV